jgi:hypothetical protein
MSNSRQKQQLQTTWNKAAQYMHNESNVTALLLNAQVPEAKTKKAEAGGASLRRASQQASGPFVVVV